MDVNTKSLFHKHLSLAQNQEENDYEDINYDQRKSK